jgi:hypothetical protein
MKNIYYHILFIIIGFGQLYNFDYELSYYLINKNSTVLFIHTLNEIMKLYYIFQISYILNNIQYDDIIYMTNNHIFLNHVFLNHRFIFFNSYKFINKFILL